MKRMLENARRTRGWPFVVLGVTMVLIGLVGWLFFAYLLPLFQNISINVNGKGENILPPMNGETTVVDVTDKAQEVLLNSMNRHVSKPVILGNEIYFVSGVSNSGNPRLRTFLVHRPGLVQPIQQPDAGENIQLKYDNILSFDINGDYIAYFDGKNTGGGSIHVFDRESQRTKEIAPVAYGWPEVKLAGHCVVWMERTGNIMDKLYVYEIDTEEITTLAVFEDAPFGASHPGTARDEIVWAEQDEKHPESDAYGVLKILDLGGETPEITTFAPGMYVYNPMTNGKTRAWSDKNKGEDAALFISVEGTQSKRIAQGVESYGVAENFVAYTQGGAVWAYFFNEDKLCRVTKPGEYAYLATVGGHGVAWFDITDEKRERDILKYAILD
ncbi:hypothetical protein LJC20_02915 [Eubacteriales bacterium OttesenSCG-928-M02]|nr:hypothetical protein [Eubacteriales bacterium OttesenSCG-928-M02]